MLLCNVLFILALWDNSLGTYLSYLSETLIHTSKKSNKGYDIHFYVRSLNPIFRDLELLNLCDSHSPQLLSLVYDCVNHITPDYFSDYFIHVSDVHSICTRQEKRDDLLLERKHITQYGIRSVQNSGAKLWNRIAVELRSHTSTCQFRKVYLLSQYDDQDD